MSQYPLNNISQEVIALSQSVGQFIRKEAQRFNRTVVETKQTNMDLVSYVDREAQRQIVDGLQSLIPDAGFVAEEDNLHHRTTKEYYWVIDPLDGTTNFVHGLPMYATSIALMQGADILIGVVYEVNLDECFHAVRGAGAFCNGQRIQVARTDSLLQSLIATGFSNTDFSQRRGFLNVLNKLLPNSRGFRRAGAAAVDLAYVACGRLDGFFHHQLSPWDVAAGALIVEEAGGKVTTFAGGDNYVFGDELLAANGIHQELMELVNAEWLDLNVS